MAPSEANRGEAAAISEANISVVSTAMPSAETGSYGEMSAASPFANPPEVAPTSTTPLTAAAGTFAGLTGSSVAEQTAADPNIETVGDETSSLQQHLQQVTQRHGIDDLRQEVAVQEQLRLNGDDWPQSTTPNITDTNPTVDTSAEIVDVAPASLSENADTQVFINDNGELTSAPAETPNASTPTGTIDATSGNLLTDQNELMDTFSGESAPRVADIDSSIADNPDLAAVNIVPGSTHDLEAITPDASREMSPELTDTPAAITYDTNGVPISSESLPISEQEPLTFGADVGVGDTDTFVHGDHVIYTDPNSVSLTDTTMMPGYTGSNISADGVVPTMGRLDGITTVDGGGQAVPMTRVQAIRAQLQSMDPQSLSQLQLALGSSAGASSLGAANLTGLTPGQVMDFGASPQTGISTNMLVDGEAANILPQQLIDGQVANFVPGQLSTHAIHGAGAQTGNYDLDALASQLDNMAGSQTTPGMINIPGYGDFSYASFMPPVDGQMSLTGDNADAIGGDGWSQPFVASDNLSQVSGRDGATWVTPDTPNFTGMAMPAGIVSGSAMGTGSTPGMGWNPAGTTGMGLVSTPGTHPIPVGGGADIGMGFGYVPSPQNIDGTPTDFNTAGGYSYQPNANYSSWTNYPAAGAGIGAGALIPGQMINYTGGGPGVFGGGARNGIDVTAGVGGAADGMGGNAIYSDGVPGEMMPVDGIADNFTIQHPELGESGLTPGVDPMAQPVKTTGALPRGDGTMDPGRMLGQATRGAAENLDRGFNPARNLGSNFLSRLRPALDDTRERMGENLKKLVTLLGMLAPIAMPLGLGALTV